MSLKDLIIPTRRNRYEPLLLRKIFLVIYTAILLFVNYSPIFSYRITKVSAETITADRLIELTNQARANNDLNSLKSNVKLTAAAAAKANDMFEKQYWDHFGPNGETPWQFIQEAGYNYIYAGENLAKGFTTNEGVHNAWMASPTHKENIVSPNYKDIGIAVSRGDLLGENVILVVQMFGNLTSEVYDPNPEPEPEPEESTEPAETSEPQNEPEQTSEPTTQNKPTSTEEKGSIKSIKIESPKNGSTIQNSKLELKGNTSFDENTDKIDYQVKLFENGESLDAPQKFETEEWEYKSNKDLSDGEHKIKAEAEMDGNKVNDTVSFKIDSTPPIISADEIDITKIDETKAKLKVKIIDEHPNSEFIIGNQNVALAPEDEEDYYYTIVEIENLKENSDRVLIASSDDIGNIAQVDIGEEVQDFLESIEPEEESNGILGSVRFPAFLGTLTAKDWINNGLLLFVAVLLIIEVYHYHKLGKLNYKAYSVFIAVLWIIFLATGLAMGWGQNLTGLSTNV